MLNEADRKHLAYTVSSKAAKHQVVFFVVAVLFTVSGLLHIGIAAVIAHWRGENLLIVIQHWGSRFVIGKHYSGGYLITIEQLSTGLLYLCVALLDFVGIVMRRRERERNQRIINTLKQSGAW